MTIGTKVVKFSIDAIIYTKNDRKNAAGVHGGRISMPPDGDKKRSVGIGFLTVGF